MSSKRPPKRKSRRRMYKIAVQLLLSPMNRQILRWLAVLPGAILGAVLSTFPLHWLLYFTLANGETISGVDIRPIEYFLYPVVMSFAFVVTGSEIAPIKKFQTAIGLSIMYLLFMVGA